MRTTVGLYRLCRQSSPSPHHHRSEAATTHAPSVGRLFAVRKNAAMMDPLFNTRARRHGGSRSRRKTALPAIRESVYRKNKFVEGSSKARVKSLVKFHADRKASDMSKLLRAIFTTALCAMAACNQAQAQAKIEVNVFPAGFAPVFGRR